MNNSEYENVETANQNLESITTGYEPPESEASRWIFDYSNLYWEIKARLMGGWIVQDKNKKFVIVKPSGVKPLLNNTGVEETMALINGFVSKIQGLSIIDEERVLQLSLDLCVKLSILYYVNMERFDLTPDRASVVVRMVMSLSEANLRKSIQGLSMRMVGQSEKYVESRTPERKKILGVI